MCVRVCPFVLFLLWTTLDTGEGSWDSNTQRISERPQMAENGSPLVWRGSQVIILKAWPRTLKIYFHSRRIVARTKDYIFRPYLTRTLSNMQSGVVDPPLDQSFSSSLHSFCFTNFDLDLNIVEIPLAASYWIINHSIFWPMYCLFLFDLRLLVISFRIFKLFCQY